VVVELNEQAVKLMQDTIHKPPPTMRVADPADGCRQGPYRAASCMERAFLSANCANNGLKLIEIVGAKDWKDKED
jgi:hypothetical protein